MTGHSGKMKLITIPATPDDGETRGEDNWREVKFVHDTSVNGQPARRSKVKGHVIVFRNPEDRRRFIVLNILKTGNQGFCAVGKERVTVGDDEWN